MGRPTMFATLLSSLVAFQFVSAGHLVQQDNGLDEHHDSVKLDTVEAGSGHQDTDVSSGCPDISDLPIVKDKQFIGFRMYRGRGNDIPALSCTGDIADVTSGTQWTTEPGHCFPIGSIFVHPGCTFYGFHEVNYQGSYIEYTGPFFLSNIPQWEFGVSCCDGKACVTSYLVDCRQQYPDCQAEDSWKTVVSFDNTESDLPSTFTYKYIIGTSWSHEMSDSMSIDETISYEVKAGFFDIFEETLGVSVSTGYNWSETSSEAKSETKEFTVSTELPGGRMIQIQQTKGKCGNSEVSTEMFRNVVTFEDGNQIIETFNM